MNLKYLTLVIFGILSCLNTLIAGYLAVNDKSGFVYFFVASFTLWIVPVMPILNALNSVSEPKKNNINDPPLT